MIRSRRVMIKQLIATLALMTSVMGVFQGELTTYGLSQPSSGNCNMMNTPYSALSNYAAINDPQWDGSKSCARCAEVRCADDRCPDQSKTAIVNIIDRCPECKFGDLDVSPSVFSYLTGSSPSRYKIKWRFIDCPVTGNIKYCLKGGSNPFWTAIQPANMVSGIRSMTINGQATTMVDSAYYYLLDGKGEIQTDLSSIKVSVTSVTGEVIQDTVSLRAGECTEGRFQFGRGQTGGYEPPVTKTTTPNPYTTTRPVPTTSTPTTTIPTTTTSKNDEDDANVKQQSPSGDSNSTTTASSLDTAGSDAIVHVSKDEEISVNSTKPSTESQYARQEQAPLIDAPAVGTDNHVTTQAQGTAATSPAIIALMVVAGVGLVSLAVFAVIVKRKRLQDKDNDRDDAYMIMGSDCQCGMHQLSFNSMDPTPLCHTSRVSRPSGEATPLATPLHVNVRGDIAML